MKILIIDILNQIGNCVGKCLESIILENINMHDCMGFWITREIVLLNFYFLMRLIYAYLCFSCNCFVSFFVLLNSFNSIHLLSYTREPCLRSIISFQQRLLTTLLRTRVNKKKRKFCFCLR